MKCEMNYIFDPENLSCGMKIPGANILARGVLAPAGFNVSLFSGKKAVCVYVEMDMEKPAAPSIESGLIEFDEKGFLHPDIISILSQVRDSQGDKAKLEALAAEYESRWKWVPDEDLLERVASVFLSEDLADLIAQAAQNELNKPVFFYLDPATKEPMAWDTTAYEDFFAQKPGAGLADFPGQIVTVVATSVQDGGAEPKLNSPIVGTGFELDENGLPTDGSIAKHKAAAEAIMACGRPEDFVAVAKEVLGEMNVELSADTTRVVFKNIFKRDPSAAELQFATSQDPMADTADFMEEEA